jgi:hypothetical protein
MELAQVNWRIVMPDDDKSRTIVVSKEFYAELVELLLPTERWIRSRSLILWTYPNKRLVFTYDDEDPT